MHLQALQTATNPAVRMEAKKLLLLEKGDDLKQTSNQPAQRCAKMVEQLGSRFC